MFTAVLSKSLRAPKSYSHVDDGEDRNCNHYASERAMIASSQLVVTMGRQSLMA